MLAIRAVMRIGWEVPNPINSENEDNSTRFPFAVVLPETAQTTYTVTFEVEDDASTPTAISGATVVFGGVEKTTDSTGSAEFEVPANTSAIYGVMAEGKQPNMGKVSVTNASKTVSITLLGE